MIIASEVVFITGNKHKVRYLEQWLGMPIRHQKIDLDEVQSLDLKVVTEHKARQAYHIVQKPVLVEDVGLTFNALGRLPGPLIKWFLEELDLRQLCNLLSKDDDHSAVASILYGLYDGKTMHYFGADISGTITDKPRGDLGFGWNAIFVPDGSDKTYAQMTDEEIVPFSHRAAAIEKLRAFLTK